MIAVSATEENLTIDNQTEPLNSLGYSVAGDYLTFTRASTGTLFYGPIRYQDIIDPNGGGILPFASMAAAETWINANFFKAFGDSGGGTIAGNLILNKTSGGQVGYNVPDGYVFNINTLYIDELNGTIAKVAETYTAAPIPYPEGWGNWRPTIALQYADGSIGYTMTPDEFRGRYMLRGKKYFVAPAVDGGSASNDGLTPASPLTMDAALAITDAVEIVGPDGYYDVVDWTGTLNRNISIKCSNPNGTIKMGGIRRQDAFRYLYPDPSGTPDIYINTSGAGKGIVLMNELDVFGRPKIMRQIPKDNTGTIPPEFYNEENTYYITPFGDPGYPNILFHFKSGFTPVLLGAPSGTPNCFMIEETTCALMDVIGTPSVTDLHIYLESVDIYCQGLSRVTSNCEFYAYNCSFQGAQSLGDELTFSNQASGGLGNKAIFFECHSGYCDLDAYSFTGFEAAIIGGTGGLSSLQSTTASNQVLTSHADGTCVGIACGFAHSSYGITDVTGTKSFYVGMVFHNIDNTPIAAWDGNAHIYCVKCSSPDAAGSVYEARNTAICSIQSPQQPILANPQSGGTIKYYDLYE